MRWVPTRSDPASALTDRLAELDAAPIRLGEGGRSARGRAAAVDAAIRALAPAGLERAALAATGGYGRSELSPGSDIDLLILHEPGADGEAARAAESVLYPLWDAGLSVGHVVRTLGECVYEARRGLESLTALLSARPLAGPELLTDLARKVAVDTARAEGSGFIEALRTTRADRDERHGRFGRAQEPDLKESLGGLRDLQLAGWLQVALGARSPPAQAAELDDGLDLVLAVRTALHRVTGASDNRLALGHQGAVAAELAFEPEPGWEPADLLMRTLSRVGRRVSRVIDQLLGDGDGGAEGDPARAAAEAFAASAPQGRWTRRSLGRFLDLLADGHGGAALEALDALEALPDVDRADELLPGWADIAGRPQRDPYHRFPVDVHLTEAAGEAARLLRAPDEPFAERAVEAVTDRGALLLGALLHDVGKVGRGSHVPIGVDVSGAILDRMGVGARRRDRVLFLVREHLLLSDSATRRNLGDQDLILHVAARIRDPQRLAMLYLLTVADANATGPSASTPWRMGLVRELVAKVERAFEMGLMDAGRAERFSRAESSLREALLAAGHDQEGANAFLYRMPAGYVQWARPADVATHFDLVVPAPGPTEVRSNVRPGDASGTYALAVGARDRLGLLAATSGALSVAGLSILTAQVFTASDGAVLDAFDVRGAFEEVVEEERWDRFRALLSGALDGSLHLEGRVREWRSHYRPPEAGIPVQVSIDDAGSDFFTVVEVHAADRLGLLFDLAGAFAAEGLDVHLAKVATYGPRVVDVFYVTDADGAKLEAGAATDAVIAALKDAARGN